VKETRIYKIKTSDGNFFPMEITRHAIARD